MKLQNPFAPSVEAKYIKKEKRQLAINAGGVFRVAINSAIAQLPDPPKSSLFDVLIVALKIIGVKGAIADCVWTVEKAGRLLDTMGSVGYYSN